MATIVRAADPIEAVVARIPSIRRWYRPVVLGLVALMGMVLVEVAAFRWETAKALGVVGIDFDTVRATAQRFLDTGSMYLPSQVSGRFNAEPLPHVPALMPSMYPPVAIYLFAPFLWLPAILWWAVPLGILGWAFVRWRPAAWTWPLFAGILIFSQFIYSVIVGGTAMWIAAFVAAGLRWGWGGALVLLKPSLAPFAILDGRRRTWWICLGLLCVLSIPLIGQWLAYREVVANADVRLDYSLPTVPVLLMPVIAYIGRTRIHVGSDPVADSTEPG